MELVGRLLFPPLQHPELLVAPEIGANKQKGGEMRDGMEVVE